ncbi:MAG: DNA-3-methyladenine glycosylase I [Bacteroidales bacterium]|nr:DNA-3-methyladenine glycosylase I [Bacteroidales bacterium]
MIKLNDSKKKERCFWTKDNPLMNKYHDTEWGVPLHDDRKLFEFIVLDTFQAGLSWFIVLKKRENFRNAFDNFDVDKITEYNETKIKELLNNAGIIRNKLKIEAMIHNAKAFKKIREEFGTFDKFIWKFVNQKTIVNYWRTNEEIPVNSKESDKMSKALKENGFRFVGTTICYAFMQAAGMINDHLVTCFRHQEILLLIP